jgi:deferrochelatase/peroxidase EfeB
LREPLTRRDLLARAALTAVAASGAGELVDRYATSPVRAAAGRRGQEQHLLLDARIVHDDGIAVVVPPLHHRIVTAKVNVPPSRLRAAQRRLERALAALEADYEPTARGLGVTVAWGLPYFLRFVPRAWAARGPLDVRAGKSSLLPARRFPSDRRDVLLEDNDVAILLRSDRLAHVTDGATRIARALDPIADVTSVRTGFAGGGFDGRRSLPKRMALAAGIPGAEHIPDTAELFLGFTSTQRSALGPSRIANVETLGYTRRNTYFRGGTHMHLSHVYEDLERWYRAYSFDERVQVAFGADRRVAPGTQTVKQARHDAYDPALIVRQYRHTGVLGHSSGLQTASRLERDVRGPDGTLYERGTAIPQRGDFNTLDNPFAWSSRPSRDRMRPGHAAGVHFVAFHPTSDDFHRVRLAMDGALPDGTKLPFEPHDKAQGFNSVLRTTHRQNFIVPPRAHRSFPLAEL